MEGGSENVVERARMGHAATERDGEGEQRMWTRMSNQADAPHRFACPSALCDSGETRLSLTAFTRGSNDLSGRRNVIGRVQKHCDYKDVRYNKKEQVR
jgi:hypothetical protein